jgi:hypothetical protein
MLNRIRMTFAGVIQRRRQYKQDFTAFRRFVSVPGSLAAGIKLPAGSQLFAQTDVATNAPGPVEVIKVNGTRPIFIKQPANTKQDLGRFSSDMNIKKTTVGTPGNVKLYVKDRIGVYHLIAQ